MEIRFCQSLDRVLLLQKLCEISQRTGGYKLLIHTQYLTDSHLLPNDELYLTLVLVQELFKTRQEKIAKDEQKYENWYFECFANLFIYYLFYFFHFLLLLFCFTFCFIKQIKFRNNNKKKNTTFCRKNKEGKQNE